MTPAWELPARIEELKHELASGIDDVHVSLRKANFARLTDEDEEIMRETLLHFTRHECVLDPATARCPKCDHLVTLGKRLEDRKVWVDHE